MKKLLLLSIISSLIIVSCSKQFDANSEEDTTTKLIEFSMVANSPSCETVDETKGEMRMVSRMFWEPNDKISVINVDQQTYLGDINIQGVTSKTEKATFTGAISGEMNPGDKLAFVFPALEGYTIGAPFTSYEQSFANQVYNMQTSGVMFCAYANGTAPATGNTVSIGTVDFIMSSSLFNINIADAPMLSENLSGFSLSGVNNSLVWKIEGGEFKLSLPENMNEGISVDIEGVSTIYVNSHNFSVMVGVPASNANSNGRKLYLNTESANGALRTVYSVDFEGMLVKKDKLYNRIVVASNCDTEGIKIDDDKLVAFAHGNLKWDANNGYGFEEEQYSFPTSCQNYVGHFYWNETVEKAAAEQYTPAASGYEDKFFASTLVIDNITWKTLSASQWQYLKENSKISAGVLVNEQPNCIVIAPSSYESEIKESYSASQWKIAESQGLVCLPPAGYRDRSAIVKGCVYDLRYWSSTVATADPVKGAKAFYVYRGSLIDDPIGSTYCYLGSPIRLVSELD